MKETEPPTPMVWRQAIALSRTIEIATRDIKPIALSARAMIGDGEMFVEKGFNGYIAKPAAVKGFLETLEDYPKPPNGSAGRSTA